MDRVFSLDEMESHFWSLPPPPVFLADGGSEEDATSSSSKAATTMMNRSSSEWAFQRFLQETHNIDNASQSCPPAHCSLASACIGGGGGASLARQDNDAVEIKDHHPRLHRQHPTTSFDSAAPSNIPVDSDEYQAFLKSRLNLACAAVALTRASYLKTQESTAIADNGSQASSISKLGSHPPGKVESDCGLPNGRAKDAGEPLGHPPLLAADQKSVVQVRSTTSGSSREQSDDDEGETETTQNMDPGNSKRARRMQSNKESARRSRKRKQAHLSELETQVSELQAENSSLLKRFSGISHRYNEASIDNRVLKADVETLRAKVKMAEEMVKRATGLNPLFQAMSELPTTAMPTFASSSPSATSTDAAVPIQDGPHLYFSRSAPNNHMSSQDPRIQNGFVDINLSNIVQQDPATASLAGNEIERAASRQLVASLENLEKQIGVGVQPLLGAGSVESSSKM